MRLKVHAQIALAVPIQPDTRAASSAVSFLFLPLAFWVSGQQFDLLLSSPHSSSSNLWHWDSPRMRFLLREAAQLRDSGFLTDVGSNLVGNCPGGTSNDF